MSRPWRSARQPRRELVACDLVLAAAEVTGLDPDEVLDAADVEVLVGIVARAREAPSAAQAASEVLVGLAASRPFARANGAAAWLAAMQVLDDHRLEVTIDDRAAFELVRDAAAGRSSEAQVAELLAVAASRRPSRWRRIGRQLVVAAASPRSTAELPSTYECPVCRRVVGDERWPMTHSFPAAAFEVVAVCARQHGAHDRRGRSRPRVERAGASSRWCPLVFGPGHGAGTSFVAITDGGPVAFLPSQDWRNDGHDEREEHHGHQGLEPGTELEVVVLQRFVPSDLIGSWEHLWSCGAVVGRVPADACVFDESGSLLDWHRVIERAAVPDPLFPDPLFPDSLVPA